MYASEQQSQYFSSGGSQRWPTNFGFSTQERHLGGRTRLRSGHYRTLSRRTFILLDLQSRPRSNVGLFARIWRDRSSQVSKSRRKFSLLRYSSILPYAWELQSIGVGRTENLRERAGFVCTELEGQVMTCHFCLSM